MDLQKTLQAGITAAKAEQREAARALLTQVVQADGTQLKAWLWLGEVVESSKEKQDCLEKVLALDPDNVFAQTELERLRAAEAADLVEAFARDAAGHPWQDEFDNEWLCPYCAALTDKKDQTCPRCRRPLLIRDRFSGQRSVWLWRGFFLQAYIIFFLLAFQAVALTILVKLKGIRDPIPFLPVYFGLAVNQPPPDVATVLQAYPPLLYWAIVGGVLYSLAVMVNLGLRVRGGHILYLANAALVFILSIFTLLTYEPRSLKIVGGIGLATGLVQLLITVHLWRDFMFQTRRIRLEVASSLKDHSNLYLTARDYAQQGMWAAAAIHLRRAVARKSDELTYHLALATAYLNIRRYDLAGRVLESAEQVWPQSSQVRGLKEKLVAARHQKRNE
jgi:tetratricopeptide (TPR) repeat protein